MDKNIAQQLKKKMDFFLKYFPVRSKNVGDDAIAARNLVWAFKDGRDNAFEKVAQMTATYLVKNWGGKLKNMVFVCVPASTKEKYDARYKSFSDKVSELCGVVNGFSHINILKDRLAVHEHRHDKEKDVSKVQVIVFDNTFFNGKDVIVFDDIVTTGKSYAIFANHLETLGANVLGGVFLGRTHYRYNK